MGNVVIALTHVAMALPSISVTKNTCRLAAGVFSKRPVAFSYG
jgi:hypothetical protein